jgi:hypothetical protein
MFFSDDDSDPSRLELPDVPETPDELDVSPSDPPYEPRYVTGHVCVV